jgi:hypothetical protein
MISLPAVPETQGPSAEERQKMVLRPGPVSLEDRLELVMSLEDVQRLLLLRSALPASQDQGARTVDSSGTGQLLDLRS